MANLWERYRAMVAPKQYDPNSVEGINADALKGQRMQELAAQMSSAEYIPNSDWLGVVSQVLSKGAGAYMGRKGDETVSSAFARESELKLKQQAEEDEKAVQAQLAQEQRELEELG